MDSKILIKKLLGEYFLKSCLWLLFTVYLHLTFNITSEQIKILHKKHELSFWSTTITITIIIKD